MGACPFALNLDLKLHSVYNISKQWQYQGALHLILKLKIALFIENLEHICNLNSGFETGENSKEISN